MTPLFDNCHIIVLKKRYIIFVAIEILYMLDKAMKIGENLQF